MHNNSAGTVHWHRHDVSTILWHCPITSMTRTLSSWCSNRTGDNRARSRILWLFWFVMELFAAPEENRQWTGPHTVLGVERPRGNFYTFNVQDLELVPDVQYLALIVEKSSRNPHSQGWKIDYRGINITHVIARAFEQLLLPHDFQIRTLFYPGLYWPYFTLICHFDFHSKPSSTYCVCKFHIVCVTQGSFFLIYLSFASVQKTRAKNWLPHCCSNEIFCQFQLCSSTFCQ